MVVGLIYSAFLFQNYFVTNFSEKFGMVSSWFGGINLASLILSYPAVFDNLIIYRKYYWVIYRRSIFSFY